MTREEYLERVEEVSESYIKAAQDYIDALRKEDFVRAAEISLGTLKLLGPDLAGYISEKIMALDNYDDLMDGYIEYCRVIEDQLVTDE